MHSDEPLNGIGQLHIDAPGCDLGYGTLKSFPDMRDHVLGFFELHRLPFRFLRPPLGSRAFERDIGKDLPVMLLP